MLTPRHVVELAQKFNDGVTRHLGDILDMDFGEPVQKRKDGRTEPNFTTFSQPFAGLFVVDEVLVKDGGVYRSVYRR